MTATRWLAACVLGLTGAAAAVDLPDLSLDTAELGATTKYELQSFAPEDCELQPADLCVAAPGTRKLLEFDVRAINQGAELTLGVPNPDERLPNGDPKWVYSACHMHYHFESFARYELRPPGGTIPLASGQKRAFCVEDTQPVTSTQPKKYNCKNQGIQSGWADLYANNLPCQWIDVTDLPPADYDLCVFLNTQQVLPESDYTNDAGCVPVTITAPDPQFPGPKVRVKTPHGARKHRAGRPLKIAWKKRLRGDFVSQEVWFSPDDGATYALITQDVPAKKTALRWIVPAQAVTAAARVEVIVWGKNPPDGTGAGPLQRGIAVSGAFQIVP